MDIQESFAEFFAGLVLLAVSLFILTDNIIDPAFEQIETNYNARADKAVTYSVSLNEGIGVHDQEIGRTPGIDPPTGYTREDSGFSRQYFRPEQFLMLPAVDTDIASNPGIAGNTRVNLVVDGYELLDNPSNPNETRGYKYPTDFNKALFRMQYSMTRDSLYDKQITYDSINKSGADSELFSYRAFPSRNFGTQAVTIPTAYGGFNITVDTGIIRLANGHVVKKGNSVIFVKGRVPSK